MCKESCVYRFNRIDSYGDNNDIDIFFYTNGKNESFEYDIDVFYSISSVNISIKIIAPIVSVIIFALIIIIIKLNNSRNNGYVRVDLFYV